MNDYDGPDRAKCQVSSVNLGSLDKRHQHRWTTLAMLAHAFLAVATAAERDHAPDGLIELTVNEFRRLFDALLLGAKHTIDTLLAWSRGRRRHQARARECHYRRREHQ